MGYPFWAIFGWCGSVPLSVLIASLIRHHGRPPIPEPPPWWRLENLLPRVIGAGAGIVGGYLAHRFTAPDTAPALTVITALAAFATAFVVTDLYGFAVARAPAAEGRAAPVAGVR